MIRYSLGCDININLVAAAIGLQLQLTAAIKEQRSDIPFFGDLSVRDCRVICLLVL